MSEQKEEMKKMNAMIVAGQRTGKRMSSLEVAELMGKQHKHVMRDIKALRDQGAITQSNFGPSEYKDASGRMNPMYLLDFTATMILITGYDAKRRAMVVNRWHELETQVAATVPVLSTNFKEALLHMVAQMEQTERMQLTLQEQAPKVALAEAIGESARSITFEQFAKAISGREGGFSIGRNNLIALLREEKLLNHNNLPHQSYIDAGWFKVTEETYERKWINGPRLYFKTLITGHGQLVVFDRLKNSVHLTRYLNKAARCNRSIINGQGRA